MNLQTTIENIIAFPPDLWGKLAFYGFLDADNWTPLLILLLILAQPRPMRAGVFFTIGVVVPQILGGVAYMSGWQRISEYVTKDVAFNAAVLQILVGSALVLLAVFSRPRHRQHDNMEELSKVVTHGHSDLGWLLIGVLAELSKLATAAVYVAASILIVETTQSPIERAVLLGWFNLVSLSPFAAIWGIYILLASKAQPVLHAAQDWIANHQGVLFRGAIIILGLFFIYNGYSHLF